MKFAALAVLAFAASATAMPVDFVEQCCTMQFSRVMGTGPITFPPEAPTPADWRATSKFDISGYSADACLEPIPGCVALEDVCKFFSYDGGVFPTVVTGVLAGNDGLLCCPIDDPTCELVEPLDNPWTCATSMRWGPPSDDAFKSGPDATALGYYCGRTNVCKGPGGCYSDPHFQTFGGDMYDFHGECDLNFMEVPTFGKGLGMNIHIRTKARYGFSFIETAALRIGDDILEVSAWGEYFLNGVESADLKNVKLAGLYEIEHEIVSEKQQMYRIYTGKEVEGKAEAIQIKTFKDMVGIMMENSYASTYMNSRGMMGEFEEGKMLARDGKTIISDPIEFGMEWQVLPEEPKLFQTPSPITGKCVMPTEVNTAETMRRRLGEAFITFEAANAACEAVDTVHHESCVYDVMATGDLEMAHAAVF